MKPKCLLVLGSSSLYKYVANFKSSTLSECSFRFSELTYEISFFTERVLHTHEAVAEAFVPFSKLVHVQAHGYGCNSCIKLMSPHKQYWSTGTDTVNMDVGWRVDGSGIAFPPELSSHHVCEKLLPAVHATQDPDVHRPYDTLAVIVQSLPSLAVHALGGIAQFLPCTSGLDPYALLIDAAYATPASDVPLGQVPHLNPR